ncbi:hypothetical protein JOS77_03775 [Chromobacterium haemolyticum]|nr:hypothetical protein JOS77_03775 [Chromobacterium haemolyticum]
MAASVAPPSASTSGSDVAAARICAGSPTGTRSPLNIASFKEGGSARPLCRHSSSNSSITAGTDSHTVAPSRVISSSHTAGAIVDDSGASKTAAPAANAPKKSNTDRSKPAADTHIKRSDAPIS